MRVLTRVLLRPWNLLGSWRYLLNGLFVVFLGNRQGDETFSFVERHAAEQATLLFGNHFPLTQSLVKRKNIICRRTFGAGASSVKIGSRAPLSCFTSIVVGAAQSQTKCKNRMCLNQRCCMSCVEVSLFWLCQCPFYWFHSSHQPRSLPAQPINSFTPWIWTYHVFTLIYQLRHNVLIFWSSKVRFVKCYLKSEMSR